MQVGKTIDEGIDEYEVHQRTVKQNKVRSTVATSCRLRSFFPDCDMALFDLKPARCAEYYKALSTRVSETTGKPIAVDTHRNVLAEAKTFLTWCWKVKGYLASNPLEEVNGVGKRHHGKPQLRIDEARKWIARAKRHADAGEDGAVAAMMTLMLGMRASEVVEREVRDVDDGGRLLWIPSAKTLAGRRTLEVPAALQPYLLRLAKGKLPTARLFQGHWRDWPRKWVQRICKEVGVPKVTAHSMRGLHSTLALQAGTSSHVVAASLGHESITTTLQSYAAPGSMDAAKQRVTLTVLEGGK
jgi:integrase